MSEYASDGRKITGWAVEGTDPELVHPDIQNAVERWMDWEDDASLPETVTVIGYAPMHLPSGQWIADRMLDGIYEDLDEEYGADPVVYGLTPNETTAEIRQEALLVAELIRSEYRVFRCEPTDVQVTVNTADYMEGEQS